MFSSRGTVRYEERGQGYRDVEKVGKHCYRHKQPPVILHWSKYGWCIELTTFICGTSIYSGSLDVLEHYGPVHAFNVIASCTYSNQ